MDLSSSARRALLSKSNAGAETRSAPWTRRWPAGALLLLVLLLYLPPYKESFVGDDYLQLSYVGQFLQEPWQVWQVFHPLWTTWYYRPLQNVWFLLNRLLFGLIPFPYYYLQALWHALVVCSVYALARRLGVRRAGALPAALLFAVNAQHHDVVAWISSIAPIMATLFSLLAAAAYAAYLQQSRRSAAANRRHLAAATLLGLLAIFTHEEGLLLPLLLLFIRFRLYRRRRPQRAELAAGAILLTLMLVTAAMHFMRPNNTISLREQAPLALLASLHPSALANYVVTVAGRWLLLNKTMPGLWLLQAVRQSAIVELLLGAGIAGLLGLWYRRGARAVKVGLVWAALHLAFLYGTVWTQKPELFAGRHLYSAWAGLSLALAAPLGAYLDSRLSGWMPGPIAGERLRLVLAALAAVLAFNCLLIGADQRAWQQHTAEVAGVARQMKQELPRASAQTQMFAHRFVLEPSFVAAAAAAWFDQPALSGGSLQRLKAQGEAGPNTYLWDYEAGRLYNALPDFQNHTLTIPLWQPSAATVVGNGTSASGHGSYTLDSAVGPPPERRLGLVVEPPGDGWLSLTYQASPPPGAALVVDVWAEAGAAVRLRIEDGPAQAETVATLLVTARDAGRWQTLSAPLQGHEEQPLTVHLDVQGRPGEEVHLTVPRFVVPE